MSFYKNYQKELIDSINFFLDNIITINKIFENFFNTGFEKIFLAFQDRAEKKLK